MAPRALWSGSLRLSLVVVPVELYPALSAEAKISFRMIARKSGERVHYEKSIETPEGLQPVPTEEIVKGYEYEKGKHVLLTPEEIDALRLEAKETISLVTFAEHHTVDARYFEKPYYLLPDGEVAEEGYAVIRDALRKTKTLGLGQFVLRGHSHIVALRPCGRGLLLNTLRSADEVRKLEGWFEDLAGVSVPDEAVEMARDLIDQQSGPFEPEMFADPYAEALRRLVERKVKEGAPEAAPGPAPAEPGKVINIMDALKTSMKKREQEQKAKPRKRAAKG